MCEIFFDYFQETKLLKELRCHRTFLLLSPAGLWSSANTESTWRTGAVSSSSSLLKITHFPRCEEGVLFSSLLAGTPRRFLWLAVPVLPSIQVWKCSRAQSSALLASSPTPSGRSPGALTLSMLHTQMMPTLISSPRLFPKTRILYVLLVAVLRCLTAVSCLSCLNQNFVFGSQTAPVAVSSFQLKPSSFSFRCKPHPSAPCLTPLLLSHPRSAAPHPVCSQLAL